MKCQILFSGKNRTTINLTSAELVQRLVNVKGNVINVLRRTKKLIGAASIYVNQLPGSVKNLISQSRSSFGRVLTEYQWRHRSTLRIYTG